VGNRASLVESASATVAAYSPKERAAGRSQENCNADLAGPPDHSDIGL
jgi:hypothetical protein